VASVWQTCACVCTQWQARSEREGLVPAALHTSTRRGGTPSPHWPVQGARYHTGGRGRRVSSSPHLKLPPAAESRSSRGKCYQDNNAVIVRQETHRPPCRGLNALLKLLQYAYKHPGEVSALQACYEPWTSRSPHRLGKWHPRGTATLDSHCQGSPVHIPRNGAVPVRAPTLFPGSAFIDLARLRLSLS
jgi:hypothetical protein